MQTKTPDRTNKIQYNQEGAQTITRALDNCSVPIYDGIDYHLWKPLKQRLKSYCHCLSGLPCNCLRTLADLKVRTISYQTLCCIQTYVDAIKNLKPSGGYYNNGQAQVCSPLAHDQGLVLN